MGGWRCDTPQKHCLQATVLLRATLFWAREEYSETYSYLSLCGFLAGIILIVPFFSVMFQRASDLDRPVGNGLVINGQFSAHTLASWKMAAEFGDYIFRYPPFCSVYKSDSFFGSIRSRKISKVSKVSKGWTFLVRLFFKGDRNDSKRKKMKFLWRKFCKHLRYGPPNTQKFRPTEIANSCGRLFSSDHLQKLG